ncbi:MAG: hypothetical protein GY786_10070 [Proteobacteria bacterium]|nr:hypothetical protein [Pseudomonadota bacterium]
MHQSKSGLDVSLTKGALKVENGTEVAEMQAGSLIRGIRKSGKFSGKLQEIPYSLKITPQQESIHSLSKEGTKRFFFTFQLLNRLTRKNLSRPGNVHVIVETPILKFPKVKLNRKGFARVFTRIHPFKTDDGNNRSLKIYAIMEGRRSLDVNLGEIELSL